MRVILLKIFDIFFFNSLTDFDFFLNAHSTTWCIVMHLCRIKTVKILTVKYTRFVFSLKIKNSKLILYVSWTERIVIFRSVELAVTLGINTFICRNFTKARHTCIVFLFSFVLFLFCFVCLFFFVKLLNRANVIYVTSMNVFLLKNNMYVNDNNLLFINSIYSFVYQGVDIVILTVCV